MSEIATLGDFIRHELRQRKMSARQFAEHVGVSNTTINRAVDYNKEPPTPSLDFLVKLSKATGTSIYDLVELVIPDMARTDVDLEARILARRIRQLPKEKQEIIETFLIGTALQSNGK